MLRWDSLAHANQMAAGSAGAVGFAYSVNAEDPEDPVGSADAASMPDEERKWGICPPLSLVGRWRLHWLASPDVV